MNIAILRTEQADNERAYNKLEYAAAFQGVRVVTYLDPRGSGTFRGQPVVTPEECANLGIDLVVAASPLTQEQRQTFEAIGWPPDQLLSHATQAAEIRDRWRTDDSWLVARQPAMAGETLDVQARYAKIGDPAVDTVRSILDPTEQRAVTMRVLDACRRAMHDAPTSGPYAVGSNWGGFLQATRPNFYEAVTREDVPAISALLESFRRNEMTTGTLGGREAYDGWVSAGRGVAHGIGRQFNVWRYSVANADVSRLAAPLVGNPYGMWIENGIVHTNAFLDDYRAEFVRGLVDNVERPIVLDLGGGFGGFGHQLTAHGDDVVYMGLDLPENLIVASYFLLAAHPDKRVLLYDSATQRLDAETLRNYDIVLMPNFMLPRVPDRAVDVFTNFISLSEMDYRNIVEYLSQVDRVCGGFFYHENLLDNGDNYTFFPVPVFPELQNFRQVSSAPSRWPFFSPASPYHCHGESLSVRRDIDHLRYLSKRRDVAHATFPNSELPRSVQEAWGRWDPA